MGVSLLAEPGIDWCFSACHRARVEHVADRLLVEPDQGDYDLFVAGEPADDPDGDCWIEWMGDAPQRVSACLPDSSEGRGLLFRLRWKVVEFLQQRDGYGEQAPCSSAWVSQRSNSSVQSTITF